MKIEKADKNGVGYITITEADYQADLATGLDPETLLKPGRHKFMRGGFKTMHPNFDPKQATVQIDTPLDQDVYQYLHQRAGLAEGEFNAASISAVLREMIAQDEKAQAQEKASSKVINLLDDPRFTEFLDQRISAQLAKQKRKRKAA